MAWIVARTNCPGSFLGSHHSSKNGKGKIRLDKWIAIIYIVRMEAKRMRDDVIEPPKEEEDDGLLDGLKDKQEHKGRGRKGW